MFEFLTLIALAILLGYALGIIGFFQAVAAMAEVRRLRARLDEEIAKRASAAQPEVPAEQRADSPSIGPEQPFAP